jgi:hypothetical protein
MEGSLVAYKVFTNGSVLQASEINDNLMKQAVAVFSNAAARTAAITSPVEGQLTYLEDTDVYGSWNGSAWVSPFGLTLINTTSFTSVANQTINSVFSSVYDNYQIFLNITSSSASGQGTLQFTVGGTPTTADYTSILAYADGSGSTVASITNVQGTDELPLVYQSSSEANTSAVLNVFSPNLAQNTKVTSLATGAFSGTPMYISNANAAQRSSTQFDGFKMNFSGNTTGTVSVYGLRK